MKGKDHKIPFMCLILLCGLFSVQGGEIPSDVTPFVRLGHLVKVSVFQNPVVDMSTRSILSTGQLIREDIVQMPVGSGTIVSADGLILTNNHVYQMEDNIQYDESSKTLILAQPASRSMLVYVLGDNDPLKLPELHYIADPISVDEHHDTALLRIVADKEGNVLKGQIFSHAEIGNPFSIKLNEMLTIFGYPSKGGDTITITEGKFLGYYRDQRFPGLDGFIKTNAAMAPGNSGGAAMNKEALVGIPTAVTPPTLAGSDLGYIHPVTWAAKVMTVAKHKYALEAPDIPLAWLQSDHNTDETHHRIYVTGRVISAHSQKGVAANVIIAREDRTLAQIENLHMELQVVNTLFMIQRLHSAGLSPEDIAREFQIPLEEVHSIIATKISKDELSPDTQASLEGEFFYAFDLSDENGFFILSVPRGKRVTLHVIQNGFYTIEKKLRLKTGVSQNTGTITLFQQN
jgi:S1-C subfamily serine protease